MEVHGVGKKSVVLLPQTQAILETMGGQIKMARLRRRISAELVAERSGISRATLWAVEKGSPSVAVGIYAAVLHALNNLDRDLLLIAKDDELGRKLQDLDLPIRKRVPKRKGADDGN
jgi:transcriptional regulator with XRE-family HTH domain